VQVLLFARSETEVSLLQSKVAVATSAPTQSSLPFLLLPTGNASVGDPRIVLITVDIYYEARRRSRESEIMFTVTTELTEYFDVPVYDISYTFDASGTVEVPRVVISIRTSTQEEYVRVLNSAQELLAQGNVTLPELRMDLIAVGDSGPSGLNFTHALVRPDGSPMSGAEVQASLQAIIQQLSWFYNVPEYDVSVVITANASACVDLNGTSTCFEEVYTVQVFVEANVMVSTENLQERYLLMSETVETPQPLVLELPFELENIYYFTDTGVNDFYVEMELVDSDGLFLDETEVAEADEALTWHLAEFFGVDASRVHFEIIAPRFPMLNNASNVRVWFECAQEDLPEMLDRASQLTATATILVQPFALTGLADAAQRVVHGQMVDGQFVECRPNFIIDTLVCKCKPGYRLSGTSCIPCEAGTYSIALDTLQCTACDVATFSLGGATACTSCHANSNASIGSSSQDACQCNPGFFFLTLVENGLLDYNTVDNQYCLPCVNGSYKNQSGNFNCSTCLTQYYSSDALSCNTCNYGYAPYAPNGTNSSVCVSCPPGSFKPTQSSGPCLPCAADTFSNVSTASSCNSCPIGYRSLSGTVNSTDCCALNSRPQKKTFDCTSPNLARSCGSTGLDNCPTSANSYYKWLWTGRGMISYLPEYANNGVGIEPDCITFIADEAFGTRQWWQVDLQRTQTIKSLKIWNRDCYMTEKLVNFQIQLSNDGVTFTNCATGQNGAMTAPFISTHVCDGSGRYLRISIDTSGRLQLGEVEVYGVAPACGLSTILCSCNTGYTGPDTGASKGQCSACLPGTYKNSNGTANCTACPLNSNSSAGSQNITDCFCDAWCYGPRGGPCIPKNSTLNVTLGVYQCSPGYTGPDRTGPCVACAVGTYKNVPGSVACSLCLPGQYQDSIATTSCLSCAADTFSNGTGTELCTQCPAGFKALPATTTVKDCCGPNSMPSIVPLSPIEDLYRRKRPWAHYTPGVETNVDDGVWSKRQITDVSGNARHAVQSKGHWWWLRNRLSGTKYIEGALESGVRFPAGSIPEKFTICSSTRYGGESRKRILHMAENTKADGCEWQGGCAWHHGHDGNPNQGFFWGATRYGTAWKVTGTQSTDRSWVDNNPYYLAGVWVVTCAKNDDDKLIRNAVENNVIIRNREYNVQTAGGLGNRTLVINYANSDATDPFSGDYFNSPWHFAHLMIWDSWLTLGEMQTAHESIQSYMDTGKDFGQCGWSNGVCAPVNVCLCNPGYTGPDKGALKGQCTICPSGTYKNSSGSANCTSCPANSNSSAGSTNLSSCVCNAGSTGPNGGPCVLCAAGKVKNVTGTAACETCPPNTYAVSGSLQCSACPANFTSLAEGHSFADCCDPNTTPMPNIYWSLSSSTQAAMSVYYAVRVSSTPLLGLRNMTGTVGAVCGNLANIICPIPATRAPTYVSSGGYNNQAYLTFRKSPTTQWMDTDEVQISFDKGMTIVIVCRLLETVDGAIFSMKYDANNMMLEIRMHLGKLCIGPNTETFYSQCTSSAVPLNEWLRVTFTYSGHTSAVSTMKVVYTLSSGADVVVFSQSRVVDWGFQTTSPVWGTSDSSFYVLGYGQCLPDGFWQFKIRDAIDYGMCTRTNFDLAGFYLMPTIASDADMAMILQAIGNGTQIAYDTSALCHCNAGFGGTGRSDCISCASGKYKEEVKSATCSLCSTNTYSTAVQALNKSTCLSCPNNSVSGPGRFDCDCIAGYEGDMFSCSACMSGKFKRVLGTSACVDCPANMEAPGFASVVCASLPGYNGLGYALDDVARSCGASLSATCNTLSNGATSTGTAADGALDSSVSTFVSVSFNPNLARSCGNTGTGSCFASHEPVFLGAASLANDGNTNTRSEADYQIGSVRPYWRVDFGQSRTVFAVKILSLAWQYLKDFKITVGDSPDAKSSANVVCADYLTGSGSSYMTYTCEDSVNGRYLYVINGPHASNYLSISEIVIEAFNYTAAPSAMLPWWAVDFEVERAVSGVNIVTQTSSVVQVRVGHSADPLQNAVCVQNRTLSTTANNTLMCSSAMLGRYLFVIGTGNTVLVLNDVRVLGFPTAQCAAGTYKPLVGNHNCTACPAFSTSVVGATSIAQCACRAGYLDMWS